MPDHDTIAWGQVQPSGWGTTWGLGVRSNRSLLLLFGPGECLMVWPFGPFDLLE